MKIIIIGAGKVGCNLSRLFASCEVAVTLFESLRPIQSIAPCLQDAPGVELVDSEPQTTGCSLAVVAVPDREISKAAQMVRRLPDGAQLPVVHCAGMVASRIAGAEGPTGIMHPAFSFADQEVPLDVLGRVAFLVDGDEAAVAATRKLLALCRLPAVAAGESRRELYHAGCVTASNFLPLLGYAARELMQTSGLPQQEAVTLIDSLMQSALENGRRKGFEQAITGPAARGDEETIMAQAAAIARNAPDLFNLFLEGNIAIARMNGNEELEETIVDWVEKSIDDEE